MSHEQYTAFSPPPPTRCRIGRTQTYASRFLVATHHQVQQAGVSLRPRPQGPPRPDYSRTRAVRSKTHSRFLTPEQAAVARQQIEAGHAFRTKLKAYWQGCEDWADRQLEGPPTASAARARLLSLWAMSEWILPARSAPRSGIVLPDPRSVY